MEQSMDIQGTDIILIRKKVIDKAVIGVLVTATGEAYSTLENADKLVDPGVYKLTFTFSPKFSNRAPYRYYKPAGRRNAVVPLLDVRGRSGIRIHIGNYAKDSDGCILIGYNDYPQRPVIIGSTQAYTTFMEYCKVANYKDTTLQILDNTEIDKNDD